MAEAPNGSNGGRNGVIGGIVGVCKSAISSLPPPFLMLVLLNALFIAAVMWFLDAQQARRTDLFEKLIDHCIEKEK